LEKDMNAVAMGSFERLVSGTYLEGLAIDSRRGAIWYSDVIGGGVHGLMADGTTRTFNSERRWTGGVLLNEDGSVLSSGPGGIMWNHPEAGRSGWLLDRIDDQPINGINEMIPDGSGGIFFGTCDIEMVAQGKAPRPTALYHLSADRKLVKAADGINFANGLMLSADGRKLYCNDTFFGTYVFDVGPDFVLSNRRVLVEKPDADGMALDSSGTLWITGFRSSDLLPIREDGTALSAVATPAGAITQIRFGGADLRDVYINTVPVDGGDGLKDGVLPDAQRSFMYRGRSDVPGLPVAATRFALQ